MSTYEPETKDELQAVKQALTSLGVEYEVSVIHRVELAENGDEPSDTDASDNTAKISLEADSDHKAVARAVAQHPRAWVNTTDLRDKLNIDRVGEKLRNLSDNDILVRRRRTRDNCMYEYRLRDAYRRDADIMEGADA